ncbi:MAG: nicotinate-nucleotide adenylyltransferase [candidate division Zixibacteria bacterium]
MSGILGGTFDPPHYGHTALAEAAIRELGLDEIIFIPANIPPHKNTKDISSIEHRLKMLKLSLEDRGEFEISDIEFRREGPSYTIDTVLNLKKLFPDNEFCFLLGADNVLEMEDWYEPERIFEAVDVAAANRPGFVPDGRFVSKVRYFDMEPMDISSTMIRQKIRDGEPVTGLLHPSVERYIAENKLYR